jgi:drug/metabolite transporter superfamily protein YnfA
MLNRTAVSKNIFYVNSICEGKNYIAYGGAFVAINNELKAFLDQGKEDILVVNY